MNIRQAFGARAHMLTASLLICCLFLPLKVFPEGVRAV